MPKITRTAGEYLRMIEHRLGSDETELDHLVSINQAASILENARRWEWMMGSTASLPVTAGSTALTLPADVRDVLSVARAPGSWAGTAPATLEQIHRARALGHVPDTGLLWNHARDVYDPDTRTFRARLELYPTQTQPTTLEVLYAARIPRVAQDNDVVILPDWLDPVFEELCCAVGCGREEPEGGSVEMRAREVLLGRIFADAALRDGQMNDETGTIEGGGVRRALMYYRQFGHTWRVNGGSL
jgi:hypothetical protein